MNTSISTKRIVISVLILGGGLIGVFLLLAPGLSSPGRPAHQQPIELRLLGSLLLVASLILTLCAWAASGRHGPPPDPAASVTGGNPTGMPDRCHSETAHPDAAPPLDRWQILPWVCLTPVAISMAAYAALHQLSLDMSAAARDALLITPVALSVLSWLTAASIALICLVRALVIKARGGAWANLASPIFSVVACTLLFPFWCLALMGFLQATEPH